MLTSQVLCSYRNKLESTPRFESNSVAVKPLKKRDHPRNVWFFAYLFSAYFLQNVYFHTSYSASQFLLNLVTQFIIYARQPGTVSNRLNTRQSKIFPNVSRKPFSNLMILFTSCRISYVTLRGFYVAGPH